MCSWSFDSYSTSSGPTVWRAKADSGKDRGAGACGRSPSTPSARNRGRSSARRAPCAAEGLGQPSFFREGSDFPVVAGAQARIMESGLLDHTGDAPSRLRLLHTFPTGRRPQPLFNGPFREHVGKPLVQPGGNAGRTPEVAQKGVRVFMREEGPRPGEFIFRLGLPPGRGAGPRGRVGQRTRRAGRRNRVPGRVRPPVCGHMDRHSKYGRRSAAQLKRVSSAISKDKKTTSPGEALRWDKRSRRA